MQYLETFTEKATISCLPCAIRTPPDLLYYSLHSRAVHIIGHEEFRAVAGLQDDDIALGFGRAAHRGR